MNRKSSKTSKSAPAVIKPSSVSTPMDSEQLVIPKRDILQKNTPEDTTSREPTSAPPLQTPKRTVIVPRDGNEDDDASRPDLPKVSGAGQNSTSSKLPKHIDIKPFKTEEAPPAKPTPATAAAPAAPITSASDPENQNSSANSDNLENIADDTTSGKPTAETRHALEEATKAEKRERELQDYINSHQFFVPIDTVARKRSVKVSIGLTVLIFILGVVLIDLMLDSGMILLVQKIPHTHFFSVNANN